MPVAAARWISAMEWGSKVAEKRGSVPGICGPGVSFISIGPCIVDMKMVKRAGRTVKFEIFHGRIASGLFQEIFENRFCLLGHWFFLAIRAQTGHIASHEDI